MKTVIYYFSATGNSLTIARNIAAQLGECELVPMVSSITAQSIKSNHSRIGLIFPVYAWGLPRLVTDFVKQFTFPEQCYVFAVTTCVAIPGATLKELQGYLKEKGVKLHAGYTVKAGRSSLMQLNTLDRIIIKLDRKRKKIQSGGERLAEIVSAVKNCDTHTPETSSFSANIFGSLFHNLAINSFQAKDSEFFITEACKGCGTCAKICPRANITINQNKPEFNHNCEFCHACVQWCPSFAIRHHDFDSTLVQYRNPAVNFKEIIAR